MLETKPVFHTEISYDTFWRPKLVVEMITVLPATCIQCCFSSSPDTPIGLLSRCPTLPQLQSLVYSYLNGNFHLQEPKTKYLHPFRKQEGISTNMQEISDLLRSAPWRLALLINHRVRHLLNDAFFLPSPCFCFPFLWEWGQEELSAEDQGAQLQPAQGKWSKHTFRGLEAQVPLTHNCKKPRSTSISVFCAEGRNCEAILV